MKSTVKPKTCRLVMIEDAETGDILKFAVLDDAALSRLLGDVVTKRIQIDKLPDDSRDFNALCLRIKGSQDYEAPALMGELIRWTHDFVDDLYIYVDDIEVYE